MIFDPLLLATPFFKKQQMTMFLVCFVIFWYSIGMFDTKKTNEKREKNFLKQQWRISNENTLMTSGHYDKEEEQEEMNE